MGAPKGNQFWKLRNKHGRDKLFATPELLEEACLEYFQWVDDNPLIEVIHFNQGKEGIAKVKAPKMRPYTLGGLCIYLGCSTEYFRHFEKNNKDSKDFIPIITRVREIIYNQKFEGAAAGFFNANIIARDLGLIDKKQTETEVNVKGLNILNPSE